MNLTERQTATVLAALEFFRDNSTSGVFLLGTPNYVKKSLEKRAELINELREKISKDEESLIVFEISEGVGSASIIPDGVRVIVWDWDDFNATDEGDEHQPREEIFGTLDQRMKREDELTKYLQREGLA